MVLNGFFTVKRCQVKGRALAFVCQLGEWTYKRDACSSRFGANLQFAVWSKFELLRTCQNRIFEFGMFVETGSDLEPQAPHLYSHSGCPGLQIRGLCPHLAWLCEPRRAVLSQKKPASRETGRAGGKIWATSRLSWRSGDAKSEVQARFSTLS